MGLLEHIRTPADLRKLRPEQLPEVCEELRGAILSRAADKSGHIKSSFGVAELTVALHYLLNTPEDLLIWDVGHQAYVHKALTDRLEALRGIRRRGGISGFPSREESEYDVFGTGHSSTALSALAGMDQADRLSGLRRKRVAVVGDGAITGGMAFEALNHMGDLRSDVLLVFNDNCSSIDPNVGALHQRQSYQAFFESLGWNYLGPADGHQLPELLLPLGEAIGKSGPRVLHVLTKKGRGYDPRLDSAENANPEFQLTLGRALMDMAAKDPRLVVVSPAMLSGAGLNEFREAFPDRCFDTGISEQHAVTFAAGLAAAGKRPVCHLYSTFAQRAYDQIIHDVALQNLPVTFVLDRAGLVGEDGATHQGSYDLAFLRPVPNLIISAPAYPDELPVLLHTALEGAAPFVIRFPRSAPVLAEPRRLPSRFEVPTSHWQRRGETWAIIGLGTRIAALHNELPTDAGGSLVQLLFLEPLDETVLHEVFSTHDLVITVEEGSRGGLGSAVAEFKSKHGYTANLRLLHLPHEFIPHGHPEELLKEFGLDAEAVQRLIRA